MKFNQLLKLTINVLTLSARFDNSHLILIYCWLRARRALSPFNDFCWEPEGRYHLWLCTVIAPFWFSTEHRWIVIINALLALKWLYSLQRTKRALKGANAVQLLYRVSALLAVNELHNQRCKQFQAYWSWVQCVVSKYCIGE